MDERTLKQDEIEEEMPFSSERKNERERKKERERERK